MRIVKEYPLRALAFLPYVFGYLLYSVLYVKWPDVFLFSSKLDGSLASRLAISDVHLDDDVMISMRVGSILNETGIPAFNRTDLAQPSTSYLAPYLFALLAGIFPNNLAVAIYAFITFVGVSFLLLLIALKSRSRFIGAISISAVILTSTFTTYSLMGWDHNLQSLFLCLAIWIVLKGNITWQNAVLIGVSLFLSVGFRPDSAALAICVLWSLILRNREFKSFIVAASFFVLPICCLLYFNWTIFGHFTPTTSRLKLGGELSFIDSTNYLTREVMGYSTLNVIFFAFLLYIVFNRFFPTYLMPIVFGCMIMVVYSLGVTDVFFGARMTWTPTMVMIFIVTRFIPSPIKFQPAKLKFNSHQISAFRWQLPLITLFILSLLIVPLVRDIYYTVAKKDSIQREVKASAISEQYALASFISREFSPSDGPIGLYLLGIAYHMPSFEIADFLGKADEMIAQQAVKWGPPGHNKWDSEATISKWNPQIIIPAENDIDTQTLGEAKKWYDGRGNEAFIQDLRLSRKVILNYSYCELDETANLELKVSWRFYLRNDLVSKYYKIVDCA